MIPVHGRRAPVAQARLQWLTAPRPRPDRTDVAAVALLAVVALARWPDRARHLLSWDAHTFAIALEDYDVRGLHPHAPGYPLYVALGRAANLALPDHNEALVALSLAFTVLALALAWRLALHVADRAVAVAATTMLLFAPLVHVHSLTANVYTADLACSLAVALASWRAHEAPTRKRLLVLGGVFALAVGVRPSILMFLAPVAAWGALRPPWGPRVQARRLWPAAVLAAAIALAWFLPMTAQSGGVAGWREANALQSSQVVFGSAAVWNSGWPGVEANVARLLLFLRWELRWALPALAALALVALALRRHSPARAGPRPELGGTLAFLALWAVPATLFYALVFSGWNEGPSGYALVALPAYLLAGATAGRRALACLATRGRAVAAAAGVLALAIPAAGLASHAHDVRDVQYHEHDAWVEAWSGLPAAFPPSNSSIVAFYEFAHVWYAFPEYTSYNYRPPARGPGETPDFLLIQEAKGRRATPDWYDSIAERRTAGPHPLGPGIENLVLFDFALAGENGGERQVRDDVPVLEARLPDGWRVLYVRVTADRPLLEDYFTLDGWADGG